MDEIFARLDMNDFRDRRCDKLSTGMKQKTSIARTLVHDPPVMIFDEPTTGLDVMTARTIIGFIRECRQRGKTVIFSTHIMSEVEKLCDHYRHHPLRQTARRRLPRGAARRATASRTSRIFSFRWWEAIDELAQHRRGLPQGADRDRCATAARSFPWW